MSDLFSILAEPLAYPFMQRGLMAVTMVGILSAVVGTWVMLRRIVFLGDALAHSILPGIAVGYVLGAGSRGPMLAWTFLSAFVSTCGIGAISRGSRLREDTAIGIVFAGMFALGIALISSARTYAADLAHFLFGNVLSVSTGDLALMAGLGGLSLLLALAFHKEFLIVSFDPTLAVSLRMPTRMLYYMQLALVAVTVVVSLQTVGVALMIAMMVTPVASALMLTRRLSAMMALAALIAVMSGVIGLYMSYYFAIASGAAIVLVVTMVFAVVFALSPRRRAIRRNQTGSGATAR